MGIYITKISRIYLFSCYLYFIKFKRKKEKIIHCNCGEKNQPGYLKIVSSFHYLSNVVVIFIQYRIDSSRKRKYNKLFVDALSTFLRPRKLIYEYNQETKSTLNTSYRVLSFIGEWNLINLTVDARNPPRDI